MRYVIAYDIVNDRRRNRVAKFLEGEGRRIQKSVFECELSSPEELRRVTTRLKKLLKTAEDCCHIYQVCGECLPKRITLGNAIESEIHQTVVV